MPAIPRQSIEHDRGGGSNRQVIVPSGPFWAIDGRQSEVRLLDHLRSEPMTRPEQNENRATRSCRILCGESLPQLPERDGVLPKLSAGHHHVRTLAGDLLDTGHGGSEIVRDLCPGESLRTGRVPLAAASGLPVADHPTDELLLESDRRHYKEPFHTVGPPGASQVVDIHVGHRGCADLPEPVENGVVNQGEKDTHFSLRFKEFFVVGRQAELRPEVGSALLGPSQRLAPPPALNLSMITAE